MKGSKIRKALRKKGYRVGDIARDRGVSVSMVSKVMHGKATSRHIADEIARKLEKSPGKIWPKKYTSMR